jgi:predicted O-methyltransferase YrrM
MAAAMQLGGLATGRSPRGRFLSSSLPVVGASWLAAAERTAVARIEALRRSLLTSEETFETIDYGAGEPGLGLPAQEMAAGRRFRARVGEICATRSKSLEEGVLLFRLVRLLRPRRCLELGTGLGLSAAFIAAALRLNRKGLLVSLEGCPELARMARENLAALGLERAEVVSARFQDALPDLLRSRHFDFVYIDGHHDREATQAYVGQLAAAGAGDMAIVIDDIAWSAGMKEAWARIARSDLVAAAGSCNGFGLCFTKA